MLPEHPVPVPEPAEGPVPEPVEGVEGVEGTDLPALIARATAADASPPFSDGSLIALEQGTRELIWVDEAAAGILSPRDGEAELVVDPDARRRGHGAALLETLLSRSNGDLRVWAHGDHPAARALAASHGLVATRELLHLSRSLDLSKGPSTGSGNETDGPSTGSGSDDTGSGNEVRPFRIGVDEAAWVDLNALIFSAHPEQGAVSAADVRVLEREAWFNADDFVLLWHGDDLIGYCWLKIEGDSGEFYVVGVHPDHQGEHLGSLLFEAGLERMRVRGIRRAHLYVEGDNEPALRLYRSRGFETESIDIQYSAAPSAP